MRKGFIDQVTEWIEQENITELQQCESIFLKKIRDFAKVVRVMLDKKSHLWEDKMAQAVWKEYFILWKLMRKCDKLFKKHKLVWAAKRPQEIKDEVEAKDLVQKF